MYYLHSTTPPPLLPRFFPLIKIEAAWFLVCTEKGPWPAMPVQLKDGQLLETRTLWGVSAADAATAVFVPEIAFKT